MRSLLYVLSAFAVMGLAYWAYHENYKTQDSLAEIRKLQRDISHARSRQAILKAEWAYLNRPDRLRELANMNFAKLGLVPLLPEQFGHIDQVAFPRATETLFDLSKSVEVSLQEAGQ